jgi:hypothetical protein
VKRLAIMAFKSDWRRIMISKSYIPILLVVFLIFGCATTTPVKMYQGEKLPNEQVAIIVANSHDASVFLNYGYVGSVSIGILAIDGKRIDDSFWHDLGRKGVEVLPGLHEILVRFKRDVFFFFGRVDREVCFEFNAEAGHKYVLESDSKGWKIGRSLFFSDYRTGKIVASVTFE